MNTNYMHDLHTLNKYARMTKKRITVARAFTLGVTPYFPLYQKGIGNELQAFDGGFKLNSTQYPGLL